MSSARQGKTTDRLPTLYGLMRQTGTIMRNLFTAAMSFALSISSAYAEPIERTYQAVMFVRESHATKVLDKPNHVVGIGKFRGLAIFNNGEIAVHRYEGWFDFSDGAGKFHGYALWQFEDGSEIRASYDGTAKNATAKGINIKAEFHTVTGSGRFKGAAIKGGFDGRRLEPIEKGGISYLKGDLKITLKP